MLFCRQILQKTCCSHGAVKKYKNLNVSKFKANTLAFSIHALIFLSAIQPYLVQAQTSKIPIIHEQPHAIYHRVQHQTLKAAMETIAQRTGIVFKIHPSLEADQLNKKLAADDWNAAIEQLLDGYNHVVQTKDGRVVSVAVTGRNHNGQDNQAAAPTVDDKDLIVIHSKSAQLPAKYKHLEKGSVQVITIPDALIHTKLGQTFELDLPNGRYTVTHDKQIQHGDSQTWIGHLDEGLGYRVSLSQGKAGVMGTVITPDGGYLIETTKGQTVWVDLNHSGLKDVGFEGDIDEGDHHHQFGEMAAEQPMPMVEEAPTAELIAAKAAIETAKASAQAAALNVANLESQLATANQSLNSISTSISTAKANLVNAKAALKAAKAALAKSRQDVELKNKVKLATSEVRVATKQVTVVTKSPKTLKASIKKLTTALTAARKTLADAETKVAQREFAYQFTLDLMVSGSSKNKPGLNEYEIKYQGKQGDFNPETIIDVMVVYTTQGQTADYAKQRIQYLMDLSNQANQDSGIDMQYRLVHTEAISYPENTDNGPARDDMAHGNGGGFVRAMRDQYKADIVILFRPTRAKSITHCGYAFMGGPASEEDLQYVMDESFAVVSDGIDMDGANSYCSINTFTHEIGHLLGNAHEIENSNGGSGRFPYSFAWSVSGKFGTIMGYTHPQIMLFSGANLTTECLGQPCGYPEGHANASDQVRAMNQTAPFMARLRDSITVTPSIE